MHSINWKINEGIDMTQILKVTICSEANIQLHKAETQEQNAVSLNTATGNTIICNQFFCKGRDVLRLSKEYMTIFFERVIKWLPYDLV